MVEAEASVQVEGNVLSRAYNVRRLESLFYFRASKLCRPTRDRFKFLFLANYDPHQNRDRANLSRELGRDGVMLAWMPAFPAQNSTPRSYRTPRYQDLRHLAKDDAEAPHAQQMTCFPSPLILLGANQ
jgi:hypothetical protein